MNYRKLRIAWSVGWGVLCMLLILLWVRSYFGNDFLFTRSASYEMTVQASCGALNVWTTGPPPQLPYNDIYWSIGRNWGGTNAVAWNLGDSTPVTELFGFHFGWSPRNSVISIPFWAIGFPITLATTLPWLPWRFSLRTLLIAITLVAAGLGMVLFVVR